MLFHCYILYSNSIKKYYIGSTSEAIATRIYQHNCSHFGNEKFTHQAKDWELYHSIECCSRKQAEQIEMHIKSMKSTKYIQNLKSFPDIQNKLLIKYHLY